MAKNKISDLDLKIKLTNEYLYSGGIKEIFDDKLLEDLLLVKRGADGKTDPDTISPLVNAFMLAILADQMKPPFFEPERISEYESTLQKATCFDQINLDTKQQFDDVYDEYKQKADTLFRGQREAKWRLYSSLQRNWMISRIFEREDSYSSFIEKLVDNGKLDYGAQIRALLAIHHIDSENPISILGYLQHHGCPTPLLDWTYKFQNSLFFALEGLVAGSGKVEIEDYFSVYYIEERDFEGGSLRRIIEDGLQVVEKDELKRLIEKFSGGDKKKQLAMEKHFAGRQVFDRKKISGSGLISHMTKIEHLINFPILYFSDKDVESGILFSLNNSKNIKNQEGVFTWNADPSKPIEMVGNEQYAEAKPDEDAENYRFCGCFNINKALAGYVKDRLEKDGITRDLIYPTPGISTWELFEKCKAE